VDVDFKEIDNKLLILYLVNRLELPISHSQITECVCGAELMDYYTLQETLAAMVETELLSTDEKSAQNKNVTLYTLTDEGATTLEYFEQDVALQTRQIINRYVNENRGKIKKDFEVTATYFADMKNEEFQVKCAIYEDMRTVLELTIFADTREQAKQIEANWKSHADVLYRKIIENLTVKPDS